MMEGKRKDIRMPRAKGGEIIRSMVLDFTEKAFILFITLFKNLSQFALKW
jgi:hypothetical protein